MRRKLAVLGTALILSVGGSVLSPASLATADSNWATCEYDPVTGSYIGAVATATGEFFTPDQVTELGCNTDEYDPLAPYLDPIPPLPEIAPIPEITPYLPADPYLGE